MMNLLAEVDVMFRYPGAVMTLAFGALTPTANAKKQVPSASKAWLGARTHRLAACVVALAHSPGLSSFSRRLF